jgi:hypothetical protein
VLEVSGEERVGRDVLWSVDVPQPTNTFRISNPKARCVTRVRLAILAILKSTP